MAAATKGGSGVKTVLELVAVALVVWFAYRLYQGYRAAAVGATTALTQPGPTGGYYWYPGPGQTNADQTNPGAGTVVAGSSSADSNPNPNGLFGNWWNKIIGGPVGVIHIGPTGISSVAPIPVIGSPIVPHLGGGAL